MANFDSVHPRPVEYLVTVEIHYLFGRPCVQSRQPAHSLHELAIGLRKIRGPGAALTPVSRPSARRIAQAAEGPLGLFVIVLGKRRRIILLVGKLAKSGLEGESDSKGKHDDTHGGHQPEAHAVEKALYSIQNITLWRGRVPNAARYPDS